eukprot:GAHX01000054.1.p1 GENE.GAHX01000054.1~~GAHX01000054.1.p1  ORF type:complete len:221 (+),score=36.13 GAHX01000054.1:82-663(+)
MDDYGRSPPLIEVPISYIIDNFNLQGISFMVPYKALCRSIMINNRLPPSTANIEEIEQIQQKFYFLVHARFIRTSEGLEYIRRRFVRGDFGACPRLYCEENRLIPWGESEFINRGNIRFYCCKCQDVYVINSKVNRMIDGAAYGPGFAELFFMTFKELRFKGIKKPFKRKFNGFEVENIDSGTESEIEDQSNI